MNDAPYLAASRRILIVEDDLEVSRVLAQMLNQLGHSPVICNDAEKAFGLVGSQKFDLLLIDYRMPEMTGLDLVVMLRQERCHTPVIIMTGFPATEERISSQGLGVFAILRKPITPLQFTDAMEDVFARATGR